MRVTKKQKLFATLSIACLLAGQSTVQAADLEAGSEAELARHGGHKHHHRHDRRPDTFGHEENENISLWEH